MQAAVRPLPRPQGRPARPRWTEQLQAVGTENRVHFLRGFYGVANRVHFPRGNRVHFVRAIFESSSEVTAPLRAHLARSGRPNTRRSFELTALRARKAKSSLLGWSAFLKGGKRTARDNGKRRDGKIKTANPCGAKAAIRVGERTEEELV